MGTRTINRRDEDQHAKILSTGAATKAYATPTPKVEWACAGIDPELFFPADEDGLANAIAVCGSCSFRNLCRSIGESRRESGVWGGVLLEEGKLQDGVRRRGRPAKVIAA
jgi:hypothetical protein